MLTVAIVIPLFFSSGALSISSKAIALALPSSDSTYGQSHKYFRFCPKKENKKIKNQKKKMIMFHAAEYSFMHS